MQFDDRVQFEPAWALGTQRALRPSGLPALGDVSWGSHICQFFRSAADLEAALVPYFQAGIAHNEHCLWIACEPLPADRARDALRRAVPDLDARIGNGQVEIIDHDAGYLRNGHLSSTELLQIWLQREADALRAGYEGLRLSGNTIWLERSNWRSFAEYEARVHEAFYGRRVLALCSYSLERCGPDEMIDVLRNHRCALVHRDDSFQAVQSATLMLGEDRESALARLQQLTFALGQAATPDEIAELAARDVAGAFGADETAVVIAADHPGQLLLVAHRTVPVPERFALVDVHAPLPLPAAYRSGVPVWAMSRAEIADRYPALARQDSQVAAIGCVPLLVGGRRLGALTLAFHGPREFPARERALLDDYARQVAMALDRAYSYDAAHRAQRRLQLLADATDRIARARLDSQQVLDALVHEIATPGFADCCAIHLRSEEGTKLRLAALHDLDAEAGAAARRTLEQWPLEIGEGIVGGVARSGRPVRLTATRDSFAASKPAYRAHVERYPVTALLALPLRASGELLGTLIASRRPPGPPFTDEDEQLLNQLAARAALSIENALLYERAQRERERAELANRAKDEFLAMLGHELRNPLSPILTAVQIMRLRESDTFAKERTIIERQVNRMTRLVDDLLDVSRIARGKVQLKRAPAELGAIVSEAIETASPLLEARAHQLVVKVPAQGLLVDADAARLAQVIGNLLANAAKYTPKGGLIELEAEQRDELVVLRVRDNGVGIDAEMLPRVFDLFVQAKQASDRAQGGLGLGLSIARSLVHLHGGRLVAHSEGIGRGSEFTVELPRLTQSAACAVRAPDPPSIAVLGGAGPRRILVVDDNSDAANALAEALAEAGYVVHVAHDGPSALAAAEAFAPELALLDIGLPVMDGYELGRRLRAVQRSAPPKLIAVTGYGQATDRLRSRQAGFDDHLVKPVELERLEASIRRVLAATPSEAAN